MIKATISQLKNGLSAYLRKVRAGDTVVIYDRNEPVARIERVGASSSTDDERLARLEAAGIITRPTRPVPLDLLKTPPPRSKQSVLAALLEERAEDR
jgi:prevent-host-death family protein